MVNIKSNIHNLKINNARLIAVTKEIPVKDIKEAIQYGIKEIGENYIQEAEKKYKKIGPCVKWHFIGKLQKNKVNRAVRLFDVIQTIDSYKLAKKINKAAEANEKIMKVMIQVNITGDKSGVEPEDLISLYNAISYFKHIEIIGLMCIANKKNPQISFKKMQNLNSKIKLPYLSMGMSNDYKIALESGSNMIRLGQAIFGKRTSHLLEDTCEEILNKFSSTLEKIKNL